MVDEVDLLEANPDYAYVRLADGRETAVSVRDLARHPSTQSDNDEQTSNESLENERNENNCIENQSVLPCEDEDEHQHQNQENDNGSDNRRPSRLKRLPTNLEDYELY